MKVDYLLSVLAEDISAITARALPWQKLGGRRVVVTGAGGFLGNYLVRTLLALHELGKCNKQVDVIAMVRDLPKAERRYSDVFNKANFKLLEWDLSRLEQPDIGDCHYILHAASQASPRFYKSDPVGTLLPNTIGTAVLLEALRECSDPQGFMFISSSEVYGAALSNVALSENCYGRFDPATIRACYGESKRMGETMCMAWNEQFGLKTYIVRPFHTYGPGLRADDGRVFSDFVMNVVRGEDIEMSSDGSARRAFCYVSDAIAGFFAVLLKGECAVPYNVANPSGDLSVLELAELLVSLYPDKKLKVVRAAPVSRTNYLASDVNNLIPDVTRLSEIGWNADITPSIGFYRMVESYRT